MMADMRAGIRLRAQQRLALGDADLGAAVAYLLFLGPVEVLLPYVVKNDLHGSAADLGLVFAFGGIGSVGARARGEPARPAAAQHDRDLRRLGACDAGRRGLRPAPARLAADGGQLRLQHDGDGGTIVWVTLKQREVPAALLGRVSSLDWLISIGLLPISFALTGPVAAAIGAQATLVAAGVAGTVVTLSALLLPGMLAVERSPALPERLPEPAPSKRRSSSEAA